MKDRSHNFQEHHFRGGNFRSGFAMILVLALLALLATTQTLLTVSFKMQMDWFRRAEPEAQLRQLALAGASIARVELQRRGEAAELTVPLPAELLDQQASLRITLAETHGSRQAHVRAEFRGRTLNLTVSP